MGPCHHGIERLRVADGGDGLQTWVVAMNILSKQPEKLTRGGTSLGVCWGLTTPHRKNQHVTKRYTGPRTCTDSLERPRQRKMNVTFGT
jgi:hypothetical protein